MIFLIQDSRWCDYLTVGQSPMGGRENLVVVFVRHLCQRFPHVVDFGRLCLGFLFWVSGPDGDF